jgi:hypothetical protein
MRATISSCPRSTVATAIAVVALTFAMGGFAGAVGGKPATTGPAAKATIANLTAESDLLSGSQTHTEPGEVYSLEFTPAEAITFMQRQGEVVTISMEPTFTSSVDWDGLFCDVHAAVNLTEGGDPPITAVVHGRRITQRGDDWWHMFEEGRDLTRTLPAPAADTTYTIIGVAWMDAPNEDAVEDCFGGNPTAEPPVSPTYQTASVALRLSIVKLSP